MNSLPLNSAPRSLARVAAMEEQHYSEQAQTEEEDGGARDEAQHYLRDADRCVGLLLHAAVPLPRGGAVKVVGTSVVALEATPAQAPAALLIGLVREASAARGVRVATVAPE